MTDDNNTRTKANAVFFSAIMVISMLAVGFAAAPAAAANNASDGSITFNDQTVNSGDVTVSVDSLDLSGGPHGVTVVITNPDAEVAGVTTQQVTPSEDVSVTLTSSAVAGAEHTAHLFNASYSAAQNANDGDDASSLVSNQLDSDTALVSGASRSPGDKTVSDDTVVFQGEDVTFVGNASQGEISPSSLSGTSGNREGTPLQMPIPEDEEPGTYDLNGPAAGDGGFSTTVVSPRINTAEVQLTTTDSDVSQVGPNSADKVKAYAEWNFGEAENVAITVEDPNGDDITNEVLAGSADDVIAYGDNGESGDAGSVDLTFANEDAGEYTVIFEGNDDIGAAQEYTIEITNQDDLSI